MKVIFNGRRSTRSGTPNVGNVAGDAIELFANGWNDFGNCTLFIAKGRFGADNVDLEGVKLMIEGHATSAAFLNQLRESGWNGEFPLPEGNYLSTPTDIAFYAEIASRSSFAVARSVATVLRDASVLVRLEDDSAAIALTGTQPFIKSLQRGQGAVKAFLDGWKVFADQSFHVEDLAFRFQNAKGKDSVLHLHYNSNIGLPDDINVLVGPNGVGKSRLLHQIVEAWIGRQDGGTHVGDFEKPPNITRLIVVSYSPFEDFPVDLQGKRIRDADAYRYFGLRGRSKASKTSTKINLSYDVPAEKAAASLVACVTDDRRYSALPDWGKKVATIERVLRTAFTFKTAAVAVPLSATRGEIYEDPFESHELVERLNDNGDLVGYYAPISTFTQQWVKTETLARVMLPQHGVVFLNDGKPVPLSSGQQLFSYIVINIVGALRRDSLVLIDEPELFLHPKLEIQFLEMLKEILDAFNSKALLATHSEVIVREVPADSVHVLHEVEHGADIAISKPPFQTFGGDIQRISSYVFNDNTVKKPFERWIRRKLKNMSPEELIASLGDQINEELIIEIRATARSDHGDAT